MTAQDVIRRRVEDLRAGEAEHDLTIQHSQAQKKRIQAQIEALLTTWDEIDSIAGSGP